MLSRDGSVADEGSWSLFCDCRRYGLVKAKDFQRGYHLAETFPGAVLAFSTLRESPTKEEIAVVIHLAEVGRKHWEAERPVSPEMILTGAELLTWKRPPHFWSEDLQKRLQDVHSLMAHGNARQQIYLGLPP